MSESNKATGKKRLMLITNSYWPAPTPRAFRWAAIAEYWVSQGHHVDVICARQTDRGGFETLYTGVHVYRVGIAMGSALRRWARTSAPWSAAESVERSTLTYRVFRQVGIMIKGSIKAVHDHIWKKLYWPDYACMWYFPAKRTAKKLVARNRYDALISVSLPYTGHLVGLAIKKQYLFLPWIVDIGDPFAYMTETPQNNLRFFGRLNYRSENQVLRNANAISVTAEAAKDKYAQVFPEAANKLHVIPPLFRPPGSSSARPILFPAEGKIRLVFVGTLYRDIRSPETLLLLYSRLLKTDLADKLELHFFGSIGDCGSLFDQYADLNGRKIFLHGLVERDTAMQAMKEADILINIGNRTIYQLPSKLIEYVSLGKPILNITNVEHDSSTDFLRLYPVVFGVTKERIRHCPDEVEKVKEFIASPPLASQLELDGWLGNFRVEPIAHQYEGLIMNANIEKIPGARS